MQEWKISSKICFDCENPRKTITFNYDSMRTKKPINQKIKKKKIEKKLKSKKLKEERNRRRESTKIMIK